MNDHADRDKDGNVLLPITHSKFNLEQSARQFKLYVRDDENLLDCKLVSSQIFSEFQLLCSYVFASFFSSNPAPILMLREHIYGNHFFQIMLPRLKDEHYSLYTMNRHSATLDIHDTMKYSGPYGQITRWRKSDYHSDSTEMVKCFCFIRLCIFMFFQTHMSWMTVLCDAFFFLNRWLGWLLCWRRCTEKRNTRRRSR